MTLVDAKQRNQATDPTKSFIVQAPAGSGKTEILTQRYLQLLGIVTAPEQIVALTFTRKAASEMRERIVLALQKAANNEQAQSTHQQKTLEFAHKALKRSEQFQWQLTQQPNRLKIITIDSLCQSINQAIPLLDKQIAYSNVADKPKSYYLMAARNCLQYALEHTQYQQAIKILLVHLDNNQDRLLELLVDLLAKRDQWLNPLFQARTQDRAHFEQALLLIEQHEVQRFAQSLPLPIADELTQLAREVAGIENDPLSARYILRNWQCFKQINKDLAKGLKALLLTQNGEFRKGFDHHVGLRKGVCCENDYHRIKTHSKDLLEQLINYPDFLKSLLQISTLPNPQFDTDQWEVLRALFMLLPMLVGQLNVLFSEHNEVDFTTIAQQALQALGNCDHPTDLALYLDNAIHHLLVDEFQDTSINQFELLNRLVQGWYEGDGKTLFLVGDPMQSIYRFRQAEVGLFYRAKEQGIGPVKLQFLELHCNFRSTKTLVNWVTSCFSNIFPQKFDIETGAVSFHPSTNVIENDEESYVRAFDFKNNTQEAEYLIDLLKSELARQPNQSIAILVRSRSQLAEIIRLLRHHDITYQGTDIDLLSNLQHLKDVWSLTQALLAPANRLSWLAILRSPYCGLTLSDLHAIACFNSETSIYASLLQLDRIKNLSEDGRARATLCLKVLDKALNQRYQGRLSDWIAQTLKELQVHSLLTTTQLLDLEQLWTLIDTYEEAGRLPDIKEFLNEYNKLYSQQSTPSSVQIMTIHKSKGLEFDTVFLPGLGSQRKKSEDTLFRWLKLPRPNGEPLFLLSPIKAAFQEQCAVYDYLESLDNEKSNFEAQRVLYVAATRAKSRLYLLNGSGKSYKNSFKSMLNTQEFTFIEDKTNTEAVQFSLPQLMRLPLDHYKQLNEKNVFLNPPTEVLTENTARIAGIITHQLLQWICTNHPQQLQQIPWELPLTEFNKMGFDIQTQQTLLANLQEQMKQLFADPRGLWIIAKQHEEHNEYELLVKQQNKLATRIIDRTFIEKDTLWIIDFKTGRDDQNSLINHKKQLNEYALFMSSRSKLSIRCGLYYLANTHWVEWQYIPQETTTSMDIL